MVINDFVCHSVAYQYAKASLAINSSREEHGPLLVLCPEGVYIFGSSPAVLLNGNKFDSFFLAARSKLVYAIVCTLYVEIICSCLSMLDVVGVLVEGGVVSPKY